MFLSPKCPHLFILFCNHQRYFVIFFEMFLKHLLYFFSFSSFLVFSFLIFTFILKIILSPFLALHLHSKFQFYACLCQCLRSVSQLPLYPVAGISAYIFLDISFVLVFMVLRAFSVFSYCFDTVLHAQCFYCIRIRESCGKNHTSY